MSNPNTNQSSQQIIRTSANPTPVQAGPTSAQTSSQFVNAQAQVSQTQQVQGQQQAQMNLTDYYAKNIRENSKELEKELAQGPPSHIRKRQEKIRWRNSLQDRIAEARAKEAVQSKAQRVFININSAMVKDIADRLSGLRKGDRISRVTTAFSECMDHFNEWNPGQILKEVPAEEAHNVEVLTAMLTQLQGMHASDLTEKMASEMIREYRGLKLTTEVFFAHRLEEMAVDPMASHLLLTHSVLVALCGIINTRTPDQVNELPFAMLSGMTSASTVAVGAMVKCWDFQKHIRRSQGEEIPDIHVARQARETNEEYLRTGIGAVIPKEWPLKDYAELAEQVLGERMATMTSKELALAAERMEEKLEANLPAIRLIVASRRDLTLSMPLLEEKLIRQTALLLGTALLSKDLSANESLLKEKVEEASGTLAGERDRMRARLEQAAKKSALSRVLSALSPKKLNEIIGKDSDEEFAKRLEELDAQTENNLTIASDMIEKHVTLFHRSQALSALIAMDAGTLMSGAPAVVALITEHFLRYINQYSPETHEQESRLKKVLNMAGLSSEYAGPAYVRIRRENCQTLETMVAAVRDIQRDVDRNNLEFNMAVQNLPLSGSQWRALLDWKEENLDLSLQDGFLAKLTDLLQNPKFAVQDQGVTLEQYQKGQQAERMVMQLTPQERYTNLLKGEALCGWEGFDGALIGRETVVMRAVAEVLKRGVEFPGFTHIHEIRDLGHVSYAAFQNFARTMRQRLLPCISQWNEICKSDGFTETAQTEILKGIFSEAITSKTIMEEAEHYMENQRVQEKINPMRFLAILGGADDEDTKLSYKYVDTEARSTRKGESRPEVRLVRLNNARKVWDAVRELGKESEVIRLCTPGTQSGEIKAGLKEILPKDSEVYRLITSSRDTNPVYELRLMGMEHLLLASGQEAHAFTSEKNEDYVKMLKAVGRWYHPRILELDEKIRTLFTNPQDAEEASRMRSRMSRIAAMLEPHGDGAVTEEMKERNRQSCGVADWKEALDQFEDLAKKDRKGPEWGEIQKRAEQKKQMVKTLNERHFGLYRNLTGRIMETPEAWRAATSGDAEQVNRYLRWLDARIKEPMELLSEYRQPYVEAQILMMEEPNYVGTVADQILSGVTREWSKLFTACYDTITSHAYHGRQVDQEFAKLIQNDPVLGPYMNMIVTYLDKGVLELMDKEKLEPQLEVFRKRILANERILGLYFKANRVDEALRKELRHNLASQMLHTSEKDFFELLPKLAEEYRKIGKTSVTAERAAKDKFAKRQKVMEQIADHQKRRRDQDKKDTETWNQLRKDLDTIGSPLFSVMGGTKLPTAEQVDEVRAKLLKYYQKRSLPQAVMDCLLERSLAAEKIPAEKELEPEVTWLSQTYQEILTIQFYRDSRIGGNLAKEMLMSVYIKNKGNYAAVPTEDELKTVFRTMTGRYEKLEELNHFTSEDPVIQMQCVDLLECMRFAVHTMAPGEFEALLERRFHCLRTASEASRRFKELLKSDQMKEFHLEERERLRIHRGLMEYFHFELTEEKQTIDLDPIIKAAETMLQDPIQRFYLADSTSMLGEVAYDDLTEHELAHRGVADRKVLETAISASGHEELVNDYGRLNVEQRQLFAMALENPAFISREPLLPGARLAVSNLEVSAQAQQARQSVAAYIQSDAFDPQVNYARALHRLIGTDGKLNQALFRNALNFVRDCIRARYASLPTDWARLADSEASIFAARRCAAKGEIGSRIQVPKSVENPEQWFQHLQDVFIEEAIGDPDSVIHQLDALEPVRKHLVILALQNRTMLDASTIPGMDGCANETLRNDFVARCLYDQNSLLEIPINGEMLNQALKTLYSFQIRNDVDLRGKALRREDFAQGALERSTVIDWGLLERAIWLANAVVQERLRRSVFRRAPEMIEKSGNVKAIQEYREQKQHTEKERRPHTADEFETFLREQAMADGKMALLAGYLSLADREKKLFVKALGRREILDISKQGIMLNRFGMEDRDYVDPAGRYGLLDEYLNHARGQGGGVVLAEDAYSRAITSALSTQIRDDVDLNTETEIQDALTNRGLFHSTRNTAIDWKLVTRALQLVHRTSNERDIFVEDRELYVSQGDLSLTGRFSFDSEYMRQNIHNAGNRLTRFLGRRVRSTVEDVLKAPSGYLMIPLMNPVDMEGEWHDKINDAVGVLADFYSDSQGKNIMTALSGKELAETVDQYVGDVGDYVGYANDGIHIVTDIFAHIQLQRAKAKADAEKEGDEQRMREAARQQTPEQQQLAKRGAERNLEMQEQGKTKAHARKNDDLVQSVASIVGGILTGVAEDETGLIAKACEEAGEFVNFLRNYFHDRASVEKYYKRRGEAQALRGIQLPQKSLLDHISDLDLIRDARGFENYTEMATFVGLNITRSLLFCAGPYNPQKRLRIMAIATLTAIGMKDAIGLQDSETGQKVYEALMGGDYR